MADVFGDQPINDDVTLDTLVGEGKKYKTVDDLAKAYVNADTHLEDLRRDLAQARAEKDAQRNTEAPPQQEQRQPDPAPRQPETERPKFTDDDFRKQLREELKSVTEEERFAKNVEDTANKLIEVYGDAAKANRAVQERARELGVSPDWLRDMAARSPAAFYSSMQVNLDGRRDMTTPVPRNEMRPHSDNRNVQNYAYFQNLKKENKALYYSVDVQKQMQAAAREQGDAFYT